MLFRRNICCSGELYVVEEGIWMPRKVVYCSGGLYAVQEGYMDIQGD